MYGIRWLILSAIVVLVDQITKLLAVKHLLGRPPVVVVPGFFDFSLVYNTGAAFGLLNKAEGWQNLFFIVVATLVSVFLVFSLYRMNRSDIQIAMAFALILGGAIGNVIDRIQQGYVVDFIHWFYQDWHWPTFNIADSAITIGAVLLVLDVLGLRLFVRQNRT
ncbi:MAG: signal peptidase II [Arenicellales bacterium]|nr:signal peptidase II [Arenicellales bacterium]